MHNNELPSKGSELKLNKGAATSELYYLLQRKGRRVREEEEETFYKSFGVGSKMQILYGMAQKEMGLSCDEG